jgi:hypothetical protein
MNTSRQPIEQDDYCPDTGLVRSRSLLSLSNLAAAVYSLHTRLPRQVAIALLSQKKKDIARLVLLLIIITVAVQRSKNFERLILRKPCRPALLLIYLQPARFDSNVYQTKMRAYQQ